MQFNSMGYLPPKPSCRCQNQPGQKIKSVALSPGREYNYWTMKKHTISPLFVDFYELTMAQGYFKQGLKDCPAVFDYFFRKNPFGGGYTVFAGLEEIIEAILRLRFSKTDIDYLAKQGMEEDFLAYLADFEFTGSISACLEGDVIFPNEPVMTVKADIIQAQIVETALLNTMNFQSLIATKTSRITQSAEGRPVSDFGLRRAQGLSGVQASRAAFIGGAVATSNVLAAKQYDIPVTGTMAHSWIQLFGNEKKAFETYARLYPENTVLLIDTYDTLKSGTPNAISVAKKMDAKGHTLKAVRLDSGDLAYLSCRVREQLDNAGLEHVKIIATGSLDEYVIGSLLEQDSSIDAFGVGTKMVTGYDQPALDGVYKMAQANGKPRLKISENIEKISNPGTKNVRRYFDSQGRFMLDAIVLEGENRIEKIFHPDFEFKSTSVKGYDFEPLHTDIVDNGKLVYKWPTLKQIFKYSNERKNRLPSEHKRFKFPHIYRVGVSRKLFQLKRQLIKEHTP